MYIVTKYDEQFMFIPKSTFDSVYADGLVDVEITRSDTTSTSDAKIELVNAGENYIIFVFSAVSSSDDADPENAIYHMMDGEYEFNIFDRRILIRVDTTSENYY
jgi:hypothetical protein